MAQDFKPEIKTFLIVVSIATALSVGGILLLKTAGPEPAPSPQPQTLDTSTWQTYRNEEFGFEVRYPEGFVPRASGPNFVQQALERGEQVSGTVAPSLETITFKEDSSGKELSMEIFSGTNADFSENGYRDRYLYLLGPCDLRWDFEPLKIERKTFLEKPALLVKGGSLECFYFKNDKGSLIVVNSKNFELLEQILSTFRFVESIDTSGWQTYRSEEFGFEVRYPQAYSSSPTNQRGLPENKKEVARFLSSESGMLLIRVLNDKFANYRGIDAPGGLSWYYDTEKKEWFDKYSQKSAAQLGPTSPERINADVEAYVWRTGDVLGFVETIVVPHHSHAYVVEIVESLALQWEENTSTYKEPLLNLTPEQILSTFRFVEERVE